MKKLYTFILVLLLSVPFAHGQNWTVGTAVDDTLAKYTGYVWDGCYPGASILLNCYPGAVAGVTYYFVITSASDSIETTGGVSVFPGDSLLVTSSPIEFYNQSSPVVSMTGIVIAVGTPTASGETFSCGNSGMWLSNLLLCQEGLTAIYPNMCSVSASTGIAGASASGADLKVYQMADRWEVQGTSRLAKIAVYSLSGMMVYNSTEVSSGSATIPHHDLSSGIYLLQAVKADGAVQSVRIIKD